MISHIAVHVARYEFASSSEMVCLHRVGCEFTSVRTLRTYIILRQFKYILKLCLQLKYLLKSHSAVSCDTALITSLASFPAH